MEFPRRITIVGAGLIGASIGQGLLARGLVDSVIGLGRSRENLEAALQKRCITQIADSLEDAVRDVDLVVVCTPVSVIAEQIWQATEYAREGTVFTDAGSTKVSLAAGLERLPNGCFFVGGHPIAGKETSGAGAADGNLFVGRTTILTPVNSSTQSQPRYSAGFQQAVEMVRQMWLALGANVVEMTPEEHDAMLARTSHLPHLLSVALAATMGTEANRPFAGTGFQSMTRLAAGRPEVWRDILIDNRANVLEALGVYKEQLDRLYQMLSDSDAAELEATLLLAKKNRDALGN